MSHHPYDPRFGVGGNGAYPHPQPQGGAPDPYGSAVAAAQHVPIGVAHSHPGAPSMHAAAAAAGKKMETNSLVALTL
jgi:hypothetical protein